MNTYAGGTGRVKDVYLRVSQAVVCLLIITVESKVHFALLERLHLLLRNLPEHCLKVFLLTGTFALSIREN